ncbi:hypothetical protein HJFPF1_00599 [Paramyrothecium foliicola]|nr:hypothetical protein HJFPF1_00599 [Paramyrothecium foliicola]
MRHTPRAVRLPKVLFLRASSLRKHRSSRTFERLHAVAITNVETFANSVATGRELLEPTPYYRRGRNYWDVSDRLILCGLPATHRTSPSIICNDFSTVAQSAQDRFMIRDRHIRSASLRCGPPKAISTMSNRVGVYFVYHPHPYPTLITSQIILGPVVQKMPPIRLRRRR